MAERGDVTSIKRIQPQQPWPTRPHLPEGQDRAPTRDASPGLSGAMGPGRFSIPEGSILEIEHTAADGGGVQQIVLAAGVVRLRQNNAPRVKPRNRYEPGA
jgi:hypothetical protein